MKTTGRELKRSIWSYSFRKGKTTHVYDLGYGYGYVDEDGGAMYWFYIITKDSAFIDKKVYTDKKKYQRELADIRKQIRKGLL